MAGQEEYLGVKTTTAQASKDFETTSKEVETAVSLSFSQTLKYCQSYIDPIKHKINNDKTNQAYTNATFGVITLLGSVAGYAPVKTVLVGLGVSGSSNGSVSTTVSNYYSDATGDDFNELLARQTKLTELLDKYGKDPYSKDTDPTGNNRGTLLIMMSAACDGTIILPSDPSAKLQQVAAKVEAAASAAEKSASDASAAKKAAENSAAKAASSAANH